MSKNWFTGLMKDEVPFEEIEARADEFHQWNVYPIDMVENGYEHVIDKLKEYTAVKYEKLDEEGKKRFEDEVLAIYREVDVFPIQYFSESGILNEIAKCIEYPAKFDGDVVSCGAGVGTVLCNYLFPNLFDVPSQHDLTKDKAGAETAYLKFKSDEFLRRSIKFCFSYKNGCPVPTNVMGGLRLVGSTPTNFRPMNAKAIYERFAPKGGTIYDFCCVDDETEFFNGREWKSLKDYIEGDKVLQYNEDGTAELVEPYEYIHYRSPEPFYRMKGVYTDKRNMCSSLSLEPRWVEKEVSVYDTCVTGNHDVVLMHNESQNIIKVKQEEILKNLYKYKDYHIPTTFEYSGTLRLSGEELNLIVESVITGFVNPLVEKYVDIAENGEYCLGTALYNLCRESKEYLVLKLLDEKISCNLKSKEDLNILNFLHSSLNSESGVFGYYEDCSNKYLIPHFSIREDIVEEYEIVEKEDKYCFVVPSHMLVLRRKGKIFITGNCGFGGRMLGALSSKNDYKYVGTDPNTETMYHLHELGDYIEMVTGREDSYELHCVGSEDFRGPANSVDFAFSSPPYFDLEVYSDEPTQCFNKFPELDQWLEGYVRGTIKNIYHMLKPGCCYAVNIADFTVKGGKEVAYVDEWIRISTEEGMPLYDTVYLGVTARAGTKLQAAGELKKENILIFKKPL